jgi:hypothetical protein
MGDARLWTHGEMGGARWGIRVNKMNARDGWSESKTQRQTQTQAMDVRDDG